jgi:DNA-binding protein HU-beta
MNKKQLIEQMVEYTDSPKSAAEKHLEAFTTTISEALKAGEEVQIPGFGKFYVRDQKAREGRNPQSGEKMKIFVNHGSSQNDNFVTFPLRVRSEVSDSARRCLVGQLDTAVGSHREGRVPRYLP